jgi:hypothetical protein
MIHPFYLALVTKSIMNCKDKAEIKKCDMSGNKYQVQGEGIAFVDNLLDYFPNFLMVSGKVIFLKYH